MYAHDPGPVPMRLVYSSRAPARGRLDDEASIQTDRCIPDHENAHTSISVTEFFSFRVSKKIPKLAGHNNEWTVTCYDVR